MESSDSLSWRAVFGCVARTISSLNSTVDLEFPDRTRKVLAYDVRACVRACVLSLSFSLSLSLPLPPSEPVFGFAVPGSRLQSSAGEPAVVHLLHAAVGVGRLLEDHLGHALLVALQQGTGAPSDD